MIEKQMEFIAAALGNAKGRIITEREDTATYRLQPKTGQSRMQTGSIEIPSSVTFVPETGKLADSEDSLLFFGFKIDPSVENVCVSADFYVKETGESLGWLSGFGTFAIDTLESSGKSCRHRNMLSAGVHRSSRINEYTRGIRIVSGYSDPGAETGGAQRKLDASKECMDMPKSPEIRQDEKLHVALEKTDQGFTARIVSDGKTDTLLFPGCDFLMQQEDAAIYVGFGAAGSMTITVSDISINTMPGAASHTPESELKNIIPDYPFDRSLIDGEAVGWQPIRQVLYAAPSGEPEGDGTEMSPVDLQTALSSVKDGGKIILEDGVYQTKTAFVVPKRTASGDVRDVLITARNPRGAILDGSSLEDMLPVMIVLGDHWHIHGVVFRKGRGPGLFVCGSSNTVESCEAYENEDTGILLCTFPGADRTHWPSDNLIVSCESHHNCDSAGANADGFGAKLSIGEGNQFIKCAAYHNVDDGFDYYSKSILGPIGTVTTKNCIAYANQSTGFKLGGENVPVRHIVKYCIAYDNGRAGFSTNSNPLTEMNHLLAWNNGSKPEKYNYNLKTDQKPEWIYNNLWTEKTWGEKEPVIMFLVPRTSGGGAEKIITLLASNMVNKHKVYLVTTVKEDGVRGYEFSDKIEYINIYQRFQERPITQKEEPAGILQRLTKRMASPGGSDKTTASKGKANNPEDEKTRFQIDCVRKLKKELGVDCAISFLNSANYINAMSKEDERCVISIRSYLSGDFAPAESRSEAGHDRITEACKAADVVVSGSLETESNMIEAYDVPAEKMITIHNPIDLDEVEEKRRESIDDSFAAKKISDAAFTFISLGRLTRKKGQWHMIRAFRRVVDKYPGAILIIAGRDGKKDENVAPYLKTIIHDNGLEENVFLPGFFDNPYPLLAGADAFVMTSFNEGFPNALVEAMATGLPVISSDCSSGPREILAPGTDFNHKTDHLQLAECGVLIPECSGNQWNTEPLEDEEAILAEAMIRLIEDKDLRESYIQKGLQRVRDFAKPTILSQWEEVIEDDN